MANELDRCSEDAQDMLLTASGLLVGTWALSIFVVIGSIPSSLLVNPIHHKTKYSADEKEYYYATKIQMNRSTQEQSQKRQHDACSEASCSAFDERSTFVFHIEIFVSAVRRALPPGENLVVEVETVVLMPVGSCDLLALSCPASRLAIYLVILGGAILSFCIAPSNNWLWSGSLAASTRR